MSATRSPKFELKMESTAKVRQGFELCNSETKNPLLNDQNIFAHF